MSLPERIIIKAKDVMVISKCCLSTAYRTLDRIKKALNKSKTAFVSLQDYCKYRGLSEEVVLQMMVVKPSGKKKIIIPPHIMEIILKQQQDQN